MGSSPNLKVGLGLEFTGELFWVLEGDEPAKVLEGKVFAGVFKVEVVVGV